VGEGKRETVQKIMTSLEKQFDKGIVFCGNDKPIKIDAIPTGSISLDRAIGIGGIPRGRITEVYGKEGSSKTSLAQHVIANAQRMGLLAAFIDAEHALDRKYAEACGVDFDELIFCQPDNGEQALDVVEALVRTGELGVIVVDSVASLVPCAELEGSMGDQQMGLQARLMGKALRILAPSVAKSNTALLLINQLREKIGGYAPNGIVPEVTPGGRALKFWASLRLDMRKVEDIKDGKEGVGIRVRVKCAKNKLAPPLKEAIIDVYYGEGIDSAGGVLDVATELGLIKRAGAWYNYQDSKWQGKDEARRFLRDNSNLLKQIEDEIKHSGS
jgi:recombination protein RecA